MTDTSRRLYLRRLGGVSGLTAIAGCSGGSDDSESEPPTQTDEHTTRSETATRTEPPPTTERSTARPPNIRVETSIPDAVSVGETLEVTVQLSNDSERPRTRQLVLRATDRVLASDTVTVPPGDPQTVTLTTDVQRAPPDEQLDLHLGESAIGTVHVPVPTTVNGVPVPDRPAERRAGATFVSPKYRLDRSRDIVNEGARALERLGTRVFKGWLQRPDIDYPFADWPEFDSLVGMVEHPHFRELFQRDFDTYAFVTRAFTEARRAGGGGYFYYEFTDEQAAAETEAFYELSKHLLETYDGTGIEIILQNWEGDELTIGGSGNEDPPTRAVLERMKRWLNARQRGISRARREVTSDVAIMGAAEISQVRSPIENDTEWIVNTILPDLEVDLVSYSAWDLCQHISSKQQTTDALRNDVHETLDFIADHAPPKSAYAARALGENTPQVYLGEYGWPLNQNGTRRAMRTIRTVDTEARDWGVPYTIFWETYDNEVIIDGEVVIIDPNIESILQEEFPNGVTRDDFRGFYLLRPDGTRSLPWYHLAEVFGNQSEFFRLDLDFQRAISEATLNPDIERGEGRDLTFACREIVFETTRDTATLNIGTPDEEGTIGRGIYSPQETTDETYRWFGRPAAHTRLYVHRDEWDLRGPLERLRLRGSGAADGLAVDVKLDGTLIETLTLVRGSREYEVQVPD